MSIQSKQNIIQLQIPINDLIIMQILQRQQYLRRIESTQLASNPKVMKEREGGLLSPSGFKALPLDLQHQIPSRDILHDEINPRLRLKTRM